MGKINARRHAEHHLGRAASLDERIAWHLANQQACACREIPAKLCEGMKRRGIAVTLPARSTR